MGRSVPGAFLSFCCLIRQLLPALPGGVGAGVVKRAWTHDHFIPPLQVGPPRASDDRQMASAGPWGIAGLTIDRCLAVALSRRVTTPPNRNVRLRRGSCGAQARGAGEIWCPRRRVAGSIPGVCRSPRWFSRWLECWTGRMRCSVIQCPALTSRLWMPVQAWAGAGIWCARATAVQQLVVAAAPISCARRTLSSDFSLSLNASTLFFTRQ